MEETGEVIRDESILLINSGQVYTHTHTHTLDLFWYINKTLMYVASQKKRRTKNQLITCFSFVLFFCPFILTGTTNNGTNYRQLSENVHHRLCNRKKRVPFQFQPIFFKWVSFVYLFIFFFFQKYVEPFKFHYGGHGESLITSSSSSLSLAFKQIAFSQLDILFGRLNPSRMYCCGWSGWEFVFQFSSGFSTQRRYTLFVYVYDKT